MHNNIKCSFQTYIHWEEWSSFCCFIHLRSHDMERFSAFSTMKCNPCVYLLEYTVPMTRKYFLHYWPFVRGIHRSRWFPLKKSQRCRLPLFFFADSLNNLLNKQSICRWFETTQRSWEVNVMVTGITEITLACTLKSVFINTFLSSTLSW